MSIELYDVRHDPEPAGWKEFHADEGLTALWSYEPMRRASETTRAPLVLALFRDGGTIVGALAGVYEGLRGTVPRRRREPILLDVRLPGEGDDVSWHFRADIPPEHRRQLMREFERAARRWLGVGLTGILYRHVTPDEVSTVARRGAVVRASIGTARMPIHWKSVDGWLATLSGSRRRNLRRRARLIDADPDLTVVSGTGRTDLDPALLARMVANQQGRLRTGLQDRIDRRVPLPAAYFAEMIQRDDVSFLTYTEGSGRLLAVSTLLHHPRRPQLGWWAGLPVEEGGRGHLYFDHYLRTISRVIEEGREGLTAGRGRLDVKLELGFQEVPMQLVAVPRWSLG